jgi:hypothetical protein
VIFQPRVTTLACTASTPSACIATGGKKLDLSALVAAGLGDVPLVQLPLRCSGCGKNGHKIQVSGRSYGLGSPGPTK